MASMICPQSTSPWLPLPDFLAPLKAKFRGASSTFQHAGKLRFSARKGTQLTVLTCQRLQVRTPSYLEPSVLF
jgi:hypothetical protein